MTQSRVQTVDAAVPDAGLSTLAQELLPLLYQHRLISTGQLHQLLQPHTRDARYLRRQLGLLRERGLAGATLRRHRPGQPEQLHYATPLACEIVEASGEVRPRAFRMSVQAAAGQLQEHTLAVNATGLAFVQAARASQDECGPLDWEAELAHRLRDGEDRQADRAFLIPDAVLRYTRVEGPHRRLATWFIELDRATEHVTTLAAKLSAYARYRTYIPAPQAGPGRRPRPGRPATREAWRERYPEFPDLLIVLTGKGESALARRTADLRALVAADPLLTRAAEGLRAGVTTLTQLQDEGPFAPVVTPLLSGGGEQTDVLLRTPAASAGAGTSVASGPASGPVPVATAGRGRS